jgi:hypothetical protein
MRSERGQASVEWVAALLCVALALGAAATQVGSVDGRSYGGWLAHAIVCAVSRGCGDGDDALVAAYGAGDAELVRRLAPNIVYEPGTYTLPVDFRQCRSHRCADAPDDPDLDVSRSSRGGVPATVFTHVVHRGGSTYVQYWFYYPDSTSTWAGSAGIWNRTLRRVAGDYPGYHLDDWEGYQVRVDPGGRVSSRATAHHGYQWCKQRRCANTWGPWTGWTRVSRGSHAGHIPTKTVRERTGLWHGPHGGRARTEPAIPGVDTHERTTTAGGLRLVPIETLHTERYGSLAHGIKPPWRKEVYDDPESDSTS